ncbi:MAG TPA: hypothetical protein VGJ06_18180 [Candidatus Acidoferrum sp.]|jgi:hypothetical protein
MSETASFSNIAVSNRRRSQRVFLKVRVVARFRLLEREWIVDADTIIVNAHGGTIRLSVAPMAAGDTFNLTNPTTDQVESCRVIRIEAMQSRSSDAPSGHGFEVAFAFDRPSPHFWGVAFPPADWFEGTLDH